MDIREIARAQWSEFFNRYSRDHTGKQVTIEAYGPGTNPHEEARALPFAGITYEPKSSDIQILLGTKDNDLLSQTVIHPTHVWVRPGEAGLPDIVEIRSQDGITFLLRIS
jgi:hypothetical protein